MIPQELANLLRDTFKTFITFFKQESYNENQTLEKTIEHIEKVVDNILILADSLELSENEKIIAEMAARFHDIGRLWILLPGNSECNITDHAEASLISTRLGVKCKRISFAAYDQISGIKCLAILIQQ